MRGATYSYMLMMPPAIVFLSGNEHPSNERLLYTALRMLDDNDDDEEEATALMMVMI